ncbi:hypothetical protein Q75_16450 [Bacillus coahuilensis p1.1.43]|uniref:N-acetyltransferase domain-containing protein n=1 Tax=Bacillus coahuilensis p1.1.43 TaxID=1150625 RepID=A0A147K4B9_9BACI|nr:hypothetical protein [Bacillus coahuilensis]KUP04174.1 hypothetical protein Q75_16450 [Bacillus coahuilensis p1.1.43]
MNIILEANEHTLVNVEEFLQKAGLGTEGLGESGAAVLYIENEQSEIQGTLAMEKHGNKGLLRSLAITQQILPEDVLTLFKTMFLTAQKMSVHTLFLTSNRQESLPFFEMLSFELSGIDEDIEEFEHFEQLSTVDNYYILKKFL